MLGNRISEIEQALNELKDLVKRNATKEHYLVDSSYLLNVANSLRGTRDAILRIFDIKKTDITVVPIDHEAIKETFGKRVRAENTVK